MSACKHCQQDFKIFDRDKEFYQLIGVPEPSLCPQCRFQRRLAYRNERILYQRTCDSCQQPTLAMYSEDKPYKIYCRECWWSDKFNPLEYGQEIDWSKPFFKQFFELRKKVPRIALLNDADSVNSTYTNHVYRLINCYLVTDSCDNEGLLYSNGMYFTKDCVDCSFVTDHSELCYETQFTEKSYNIKYSKDCINCRDSSFLIDCVGCSNCFMCVGLRNKSFCFKNEELSEEEYKKTIAQYQLLAVAKWRNIKKNIKNLLILYQESIFMELIMRTLMEIIY